MPRVAQIVSMSGFPPSFGVWASSSRLASASFLGCPLGCPRVHDAGPPVRIRFASRARFPSGSELSVEPGVADGLVPVDVEPTGDMGQELSQLHGVPGATAAARLRKGVGAP